MKYRVVHASTDDIPMLASWLYPQLDLQPCITAMKFALSDHMHIFFIMDDETLISVQLVRYLQPFMRVSRDAWYRHPPVICPTHLHNYQTIMHLFDDAVSPHMDTPKPFWDEQG